MYYNDNVDSSPMSHSAVATITTFGFILTSSLVASTKLLDCEKIMRSGHLRPQGCNLRIDSGIFKVPRQLIAEEKPNGKTHLQVMLNKEHWEKSNGKKSQWDFQ